MTARPIGAQGVPATGHSSGLQQRGGLSPLYLAGAHTGLEVGVLHPTGDFISRLKGWNLKGIDIVKDK